MLRIDFHTAAARREAAAARKDAAKSGGLRRNFQGYTDDPCETLIGFGASAISRLPGGYVQNAVATAAYVERVEGTWMATAAACAVACFPIGALRSVFRVPWYDH